MTDTARLRELEAKATPGPWYAAKDYGQLPETSRQSVRHTIWGSIAVMSFPDDGCDVANAAAAEQVETTDAILALFDQAHGVPVGVSHPRPLYCEGGGDDQ